MLKEFVIEGERTTSLEAFYDEVSRTLIPGAYWGRNLDAFNDILRGGFGTPDEGFVIRWRDAAAARASLSYSETVRQLELRLERCHPTNRDSVREDLPAAAAGRGPTVFDWLIGIIQDHGPGGAEETDNVHLILD
jgi:RNAse (barnase) inhibitor barstar